MDPDERSGNTRKKQFKKGFTAEDARRKREDDDLQIRRSERSLVDMIYCGLGDDNIKIIHNYKFML